MEGLPKNKKIILFDGFCNLCDTSVQFIIKNDKKDVFRFVALQSELGQKIIDYIGINSTIDSIILYIPKKAYHTKADAVLLITKELSGTTSFLYYFRHTPKLVKNSVYDFIAKNRYKWYGKKENCMIPTPDILNKFLV